MLINRAVKKATALALAGAAVAVAAEVAAQPVGAQPGSSGRLCTNNTNARGYPTAVPPILPPPPCSALPAILSQEAFEGQEFWSDPPSNARYSMAELNAYASEART
jgi:hypothetical protein